MMDVDVTALHHKLTDPDVGFQQPLDAVRMTLILFAETFLFGSEYKENVSSWLFSFVEKLDQFNIFL